MAAVEAVAIAGGPLWDDEIWEELLAYIEEERVIPIVGPASSTQRPPDIARILCRREARVSTRSLARSVALSPNPQRERLWRPAAARDRQDAPRRAAAAQNPLRVAPGAQPRPLGAAGARRRGEISDLD
jgi:hypothetical protein